MKHTLQKVTVLHKIAQQIPQGCGRSETRDSTIKTFAYDTEESKDLK